MSQVYDSLGDDLARCSEWTLEDVQRRSGLELFLARDFLDQQDLSSPCLRCRIEFDYPASWAVVEMSLMRQYFPRDDCPPVITERPSNGLLTFVDGFTINQELEPGVWRCFRVCTAMEVVEVISKTAPTVSFYES